MVAAWWLRCARASPLDSLIENPVQDPLQGEGVRDETAAPVEDGRHDSIRPAMRLEVEKLDAQLATCRSAPEGEATRRLVEVDWRLGQAGSGEVEVLHARIDHSSRIDKCD